MKKEMLVRLAGYGAFAAIGGLAAVFVGFVFLTVYNGAGIDRTESIVARIAIGLVILLLAIVHVVYARILLDVAKGKRFGI